jgi:hypothetical protein
VARLFLFDVRCPDGPATAVPELTRQRAHERSTLKRTRRAERADRHLDNRRIGDHRAGPIVVDDWPSEEEELAPARRRLYEFQPRSYPAPISLFLNEEWHRRDPTAGWGAVATGGLAVEVLPGRHGDHLMDQMDALAGRLRELLDTIDPIPPGKRH